MIQAKRWRKISSIKQQVIVKHMHHLNWLRELIFYVSILLNVKQGERELLLAIFWYGFIMYNMSLNGWIGSHLNIYMGKYEENVWVTEKMSWIILREWILTLN